MATLTLKQQAIERAAGRCEWILCKSEGQYHPGSLKVACLNPRLGPKPENLVALCPVCWNHLRTPSCHLLTAKHLQGLAIRRGLV